MGKPRVNQFAEDLGISRSEAMKLIKAGRNRRDGGSTVLENNMNKMKSYKRGGTNSVGPVPLPDEAKRIRLAAALDPERREDKDALTKEQITKQMLEMESKAEKARTKEMVEEKLMTREEFLEKYGPKGRKAGGLERRGDDRPVIMAKDGKYNNMGDMCRGGGKAIRGTKFSGVK